MLVELKLIEKALSLQIPILGICLGAQLLAQALGAVVYSLVQPEFGWHKINTVKGNDYLPQLANDLHVFQWHQFSFECPTQAKLLAYNDDNHAQAFSYDNTLALQFHLEVDKKLSKHWLGHIKYLEALSKHLSDEEVDFIKEQTLEKLHLSQKYGIQTFNSFLDLIAPQPLVFKSMHAGK